MTLRRAILVCDDSDEDFDTMCDAVNRSKAELLIDVHRAESGDTCLRLLRSLAPQARPLLVVLDLNLPGLDGRDTLREIRHDPLLRDLPVVVFTTSANPRDVEFCYRAGANAYHVKPVKYLDYLRTVQSLIEYWLGQVVLPAAPGRSHD